MKTKHWREKCLVEMRDLQFFNFLHVFFCDCASSGVTVFVPRVY